MSVKTYQKFAQNGGVFRVISNIYDGALTDDSPDRLRKTSYNLKTRPVRENKIEVMRMACDLDVNSDLTNFFVQNIGDEIEIVVEKKV